MYKKLPKTPRGRNTIKTRCCVLWLVLFYMVAPCLFLIFRQLALSFSLSYTRTRIHWSLRLNAIQLACLEPFLLHLVAVCIDYLLCQQFALIISEQWACITATSKGRKTARPEARTRSHAMNETNMSQSEFSAETSQLRRSFILLILLGR